LPAPAQSSIALGDQKATNAGLLHSALFKGFPAPPDADLVFAFCPKLDATPCPVRVLPQDLSADCYARYSVHLSSTEFQPHWLVAECIAKKACNSFWFKGAFLASPKPTGRMLLLLVRSMHIFPCPQSFIGYVLAHGTPTALFMARQNIYIIINDTCSYRSEGDASRNGS